MQSLWKSKPAEFDDGAVKMLVLIAARDWDNRVVERTISLMREVGLSRGPAEAAWIECALSRAITDGDTKRAVLYANAITTLPWEWHGIAKRLEFLLDQTRKTDPANKLLLAGLSAAYLAAAPDAAARYIDQAILAQHPFVNAIAGNMGAGTPDPHALNAPAREAPRLPDESRLAVATAVLTDLKNIDGRLSAIKPSLSWDDNAIFVSDPAFTKALLNKHSRQLMARQALHLHMFGTYILTEGFGHHGERTAKIAEYAKEYAAVLHQYGDRLDATTLSELRDDGTKFNDSTSSEPVPAQLAGALAFQARCGPFSGIVRFFAQNPFWTSVLLVPLAWVGWLLVLRAIPLMILRNERYLVAARDANVPVLSGIIKIGFSVSQIHSTIVQDRWVWEALRLEFADPIIELSEGIVRIPVRMRMHDMADFGNPTSELREQLRDIASTGRLRLMITGEGGAGKTTLASYVASLAQHEAADARILKERAFVVTLTAEIEPSVKTPDAVLEEICSRLRSIHRLSPPDEAGVQHRIDLETTLPVYRPLVEDMLVDGRLFLVLDGVSEMPKDALSAVRSFLAQKKVRYVVATSRNETALGGSFGTTVRPDRIIGKDELLRFVNDYREKRGLKLSQTSNEIATRLDKISNSQATPLLVWLYLKLLPAQASPDDDETAFRLNVLYLMEEYVRWLNAKVQADQLPTDAVLSTSRTIAMLCCVQSRTFSASSADYGGIRKYLSLVDKTAGDRVDYFIDSLTLLQRVGKAEDRIKFAIDSLSEYLAGSYITHLCRDDYDSAWNLLTHDDEVDQVRALLDFSNRVTECVTAELENADLIPRERQSLTRLGTALEKLRHELTKIAERTPA